MYGADPSLAERLGLHRQWLHAVELALDHPGTRERMTFAAPYPDDLQIALDRIGAP
jgi:23S rRNA pseudouridine1911/1915/1917 synthase